ncbi:hypothetical protein GQ42DRAFT_164682 [Ramicandelaber brevisporus]|nr:hypothetical protein GQ42DRAFT_164682 [Ramicandelaber brevisporus]
MKVNFLITLLLALVLAISMVSAEPVPAPAAAPAPVFKKIRGALGKVRGIAGKVHGAVRKVHSMAGRFGIRPPGLSQITQRFGGIQGIARKFAGSPTAIGRIGGMVSRIASRIPALSQG